MRFSAVNNAGHTVSPAALTLAHVQQARQVGARQRAEVLVEDAELAAAQGEHHGVGGHELVQLAVVLALRLRAVAAAHQEDVLQPLLLDSLNHLGSHAQNRLVAKAHLCRWNGWGQRARSQNAGIGT